MATNLKFPTKEKGWKAKIIDNFHQQCEAPLPLPCHSGSPLQSKCREKGPLISVSSSGCITAERGQKKLFNLHPQDDLEAITVKAPLCFPLLLLCKWPWGLIFHQNWQFVQEATHIERKGEFSGMSACVCRWNYSVVCKWESVHVGKWVLTQLRPPHSCVCSRCLGLKISALIGGYLLMQLVLRVVVLGIHEEKHEKVKGERMCMQNPGVAKWKGRVRPKTWLLLNALFYFRSEWFHYPDIIHWGSASFPFQLQRFHTWRTRVCHCIPIRSLSNFWRARTPSWVNEIHLGAGSNPIQSACSVAYLRFNYTTHLISQTVHAAPLLYAWTDATFISHLFCTPLKGWIVNRIAWGCCHPDGIGLKGQLR